MECLIILSRVKRELDGLDSLLLKNIFNNSNVNRIINLSRNILAKWKDLVTLIES